MALGTYGKAKQDWLETFLQLPHGVPSHDTFGQVMSALEPEELERGFLAWISQLNNHEAMIY
ncbi:transposase family protein [Leptolyngbya sp. PCC 6406]|uniref:transposase family protein n=1 Tax=Leptolyngbya sp. PCC 6406 TaxID=1173264 RepID=UPI0002E515B0|nr:transposase family protein [Leptolyngbya sp. PCC 6406]